jgi:hypothetical protein
MKLIIILFPCSKPEVATTTTSVPVTPPATNRENGNPPIMISAQPIDVTGYIKYKFVKNTNMSMKVSTYRQFYQMEI